MKNLLLNKSTLTALSVFALLSSSFVMAMNDPDTEDATKKAQTASARKAAAEQDLEQAKKDKKSAEKQADKDNFSAEADEQKAENVKAGGKPELTRDQQNAREVERLARQAESTVNKVGDALGLK
ncbi:MAG: hypothetical protein JSS34_05820 [Proteobacteria bacterium]|nr:hypothetical protein [Pseudomonadota bacterium]